MILASDSLAAVSLAAGPAALGRSITLRAGARLSITPSRVQPVTTVDLERLQAASIIVNSEGWGMANGNEWGLGA